MFGSGKRKGVIVQPRPSDTTLYEKNTQMERRQLVSMDFDELAQGLANRTVTRRRALAVLAASAAGALFPFARAAEGQPGCRRIGHPCEGNQECCPGLVCRVTGPGNAERCAKPKKKKY